MIESVIPFLTRIGAKRWRHDRTGEIFDGFQVLERYGDHPLFRRKQRREKWLDEIQKSLLVFSISTHRLKTEEQDGPDFQNAGSSILMVDSIAKEIREKIQIAIRNQFDIGRKMETSFPARLIASLARNQNYSKDTLVNLINAVQEYETRLSPLGLVPNTGTTEQLSQFPPIADPTGMLVLKTYLDDILEKFSALDALAKQLEVFCRSIDSLMAFKTIETSPDEGIIVRIIDGERTPLSLQVLSSGEQHLIVLIGKLIFGTDAGALVLIDEPEISFHPEWQEKFIDILADIREINDFSVLIATHSPILIGEHWDIVVELAEQHTQSQLDHSMEWQ
jgi:predicted ATP-dependent endonuclease of OLD family